MPSLEGIGKIRVSAGLRKTDVSFRERPSYVSVMFDFLFPHFPFQNAYIAQYIALKQ